MMSSQHMSKGTNFFLQPWDKNKDSTFIDQSLARAIGRSYSKALCAEWEKYRSRKNQSIARNSSPYRKVKNNRQLRERQLLLDKLLGNLIPISTANINANSKCATISLGLRPDNISATCELKNTLQIFAWILLMPGFLQEIYVPMRISPHAVERVIQRAGVVDLPVNQADMQAINAEFADMLPLAALAIDVMKNLAKTTSDEEAENLTMLLPSAHGLFIASWCPEISSLLVRTFIDSKKLNPAQVQAVNELRSITDINVAPLLVDTMIPGWFRFDKTSSYETITQAWKHFAWRFDIDRLHPGMSDIAWSQ